MSQWIEVTKDYWVNFADVTAFTIDEKEKTKFIRLSKFGAHEHKISMNETEINEFRSKIHTLTNSIKKEYRERSDEEPSKTHIIADHVAQLEDIAGIHLEVDELAIYIFYKKNPKYSQLEIDGKYIVHLKILEDHIEEELTKLNEAWAKYLNYYT